MQGGLSSCHGVLLYDTTKNIAIYGYYENDEIIILDGTYQELAKIRANYNNKYTANDAIKNTILIWLVIIMLVSLILSWVIFDFYTFIVCIGFWFISFMPILSLSYTWRGLYNTAENNHLFKRYHALEHQMLNLIDQEKEINLNNLKQMSIYEKECGNVYSGTLLVFSTICTCILLNIGFIGIFKALGYIVIVFMILFLNLLNPYNPLILLQKNMIEKPTECEYLLAIEMLKKAKTLGMY